MSCDSSSARYSGSAWRPRSFSIASRPGSSPSLHTYGKRSRAARSRYGCSQSASSMMWESASCMGRVAYVTLATIGAGSGPEHQVGDDRAMVADERCVHPRAGDPQAAVDRDVVDTAARRVRRIRRSRRCGGEAAGGEDGFDVAGFEIEVAGEHARAGSRGERDEHRRQLLAAAATAVLEM